MRLWFSVISSAYHDSAVRLSLRLERQARLTLFLFGILLLITGLSRLSNAAPKAEPAFAKKVAEEDRAKKLAEPSSVKKSESASALKKAESDKNTIAPYSKNFFEPYARTKIGEGAAGGLAETAKMLPSESAKGSLAESGITLAAEAADVPYDDTLVRNSVGNLFKFIEGSFGALLVVGAGIGAIVAAAMGAYKVGLTLLVVSVGAFILRAYVSLFFGANYPDYEVGNF